LDGCRFFRERGPGKVPGKGSCRIFFGCRPRVARRAFEGAQSSTAFWKLDAVLPPRGSRGGMELGAPGCSRDTSAAGTRAVRSKIGLAIFKFLVYCADDVLTRS
jgi:hypothetical protein